MFLVRCCCIGAWTGCDLLLRVPITVTAIPSSPAARRGATQSPSCYCSTCSAVLATCGAVMGACCSLFSRRSAKAASLVPGKRGAVTPLGEPSLVLCSRACAAIYLEPEACLTVQGLLCVHLGKAPNLHFIVLFALFHRIARQLLDNLASRLSGCTVARQRLGSGDALRLRSASGNLHTSSLQKAAPGARQRPSSGGSCGADARGHRRWACYRRWRRPRLPQRAESPAGEVRCPILLHFILP